jgi:hypothetical protein
VVNVKPTQLDDVIGEFLVIILYFLLLSAEGLWLPLVDECANSTLAHLNIDQSYAAWDMYGMILAARHSIFIIE